MFETTSVRPALIAERPELLWHNFRTIKNHNNDASIWNLPHNGFLSLEDNTNNELNLCEGWEDE